MTQVDMATFNCKEENINDLYSSFSVEALWLTVWCQ